MFCDVEWIIYRNLGTLLKLVLSYLLWKLFLSYKCNTGIGYNAYIWSPFAVKVFLVLVDIVDRYSALKVVLSSLF